MMIIPAISDCLSKQVLLILIKIQILKDETFKLIIIQDIRRMILE
jgi:hypothetical protein